MNLRLGIFCTLITALLPIVCSTSRGDILVGSWGTHEVFRVDETNGNVSSFVASGSGGLSTPDGLAYGPDGNLYVSSADTNQVLRYNGSTGSFIDVFASSNINRAGFLSFGPDQNLYVCSSNSGQVLRFNGQTGAFMDVFASSPQLTLPAGLAWNDGLLYVTDFNGGQVVRFDASSGSFVDVWSTDPVNPIYPLFDRDGNFLVADYGASRIIQYDENGNVVSTLTSAMMNGPVGMLELHDGSLLVTSWNNHRILRFDRDTGSVISNWGGISRPNDVIFMAVPEPSGAFVLGSMLFVLVSNCRKRTPLSIEE